MYFPDPDWKIGQCKMLQTADYCFHHANENMTTIVPLFSNPKNNSPKSVGSLHLTLPHRKIKKTYHMIKISIFQAEVKVFHDLLP